MIASLNGKLISRSTTAAVVECGGVGYFVNVSIATSDKLPEIGQNVFLLTVFQMREDAVNLYGFSSESEREAFNMLTSVSGIGAKTSLGILSSVSPESLSNFIINQNLPALQKMPGIGKKTAERLCFELRDKAINLLGSDSSISPVTPNQAIVNESVAALIALGYNKNTAEKAVKSAQSSISGELKIENLIKVALKYTMN
ncbi:MAG: Holliday junction branch migration protein RuvA [Candidatus Kapabacteria bacterium]|nr:Holliday junction branch migration protein RuvA [Ignavibacteriota bacterium]MCW5884775.1 Holliday junction branch migration protein RuvA [Candidatus Kapabacteria bacterium]